MNKLLHELLTLTAKAAIEAGWAPQKFADEAYGYAETEHKKGPAWNKNAENEPP